MEVKLDISADMAEKIYDLCKKENNYYYDSCFNCSFGFLKSGKNFSWIRNSVHENYFFVDREKEYITISGRRNSIVEFIGWLLPAEIKNCKVVEYKTSQPTWEWFDTLKSIKKETSKILEGYLV